MIIDRILGVPPGSVEIIGSLDYLRSLFVAWNKKPKVRGLGPERSKTAQPQI
jgi:hypothetical protein